MSKFVIDIGEIEIDLKKKTIGYKGKEKKPLFTPGRRKVDPNSRTARVVEAANEFLTALDSKIESIKLKEVVDYVCGALPEFERRVIYSAVYTATRHNRLKGFFYDKDQKCLVRKKEEE